MTSEQVAAWEYQVRMIVREEIATALNQLGYRWCTECGGKYYPPGSKTVYSGGQHVGHMIHKAP